MGSVMASVATLYAVFAVRQAPAEPWVCPQCAPELTAADVSATELSALTFEQLTAIHVMALDDEALRHYFPRLMELLLVTPAPVFDFPVAEVKARVASWTSAELAVTAELADAVWAELLTTYPLKLGYFSDCPSALDLLDWCGLSPTPRLDQLITSDLLPAARHLAALVDAVFTSAKPFETASKAAVVEWIGRAEVGVRLQEAFFAADSDDALRELSAAQELWTICAG
jgi:hypothetical protein